MQIGINSAFHFNIYRHIDIFNICLFSSGMRCIILQTNETNLKQFIEQLDDSKLSKTQKFGLTCSQNILMTFNVCSATEKFVKKN